MPLHGGAMNKARLDLKARWGPVVDCIADLLGANAEVVLHDVRHPEHSIVMIRNGHITGRQLGAPLTDLGFFMLRESEKRIETLGIYYSRTENGKVLKCNGANLRDARGNIEAMLCINIDVTNEMHTMVRNGDQRHVEHYRTDIEQVIDSMIDDAVRQAKGPLTQEQKLELIRALESRGVFLARGAVKRVATALTMAVPTVYKYIQRVRHGRAPLPRREDAQGNAGLSL
jgi:predicted transcriptional regulator YheO